MIFATFIYFLCALTSSGCAVLLFRSYRRNPRSLFLWATASFTLLAINNVLLVADLAVFPAIDLALLRQLFQVAGACVLVYGLLRDVSS
jgi:hypothetical protein